MTALAYYNENNAHAAQWLRNLIAAGHIAPGDVDERSIEDVKPDDLRPYTQCHFFAGVGIWSHALRLAGWPDNRPVWTGSCPCQPFSPAGQGAGFTDERHLWPAWFHLITEYRPDRIFGEQSGSKAALAWLDLVQADLEGAGYASGPVDLCAAGVGAPHIRQRLGLVAERVGDPDRPRLERLPRHGSREVRRSVEARPAPEAGSDMRLADTNNEQQRQRRAAGSESGPGDETGAEPSRRGPTNGYWRDADWLLGRDEKWRPVRPGTLPLADGVAGRVGKLRAYGNGIVPQEAQAIIEAYGVPT